MNIHDQNHFKKVGKTTPISGKFFLPKKNSEKIPINHRKIPENIPKNYRRKMVPKISGRKKIVTRKIS